ncbi:MAG: cyclic nucleotide-binding domain-containing protein [Spirochaetales bacterium]|nr:cyclic nucleotide-binding domain-containing protein [Spirochaetales bacterium]
MKIETKKFAKGAFIYLESDTNVKQFYIIKSGNVQLSRFSDFGGQMSDIRGIGYIIGIIQCISGLRLNERAIALTDCELLVIYRDQIEQLYTDHPKTILKIIAEYSEILRTLDKELLKNSIGFEYGIRNMRIFELVQGYLTIGDKHKAAHLLQSFISEPDISADDKKRALSTLQSLPKVQLHRPEQMISEHRYSAGNVIFTENELGDVFYIIKSGKVRITKLESLNNNEAFIASLGVGDIFGEMAILNDKPRNASAVAETESLLMIIRKDGINQLPPSMFVKILMLLTRRIWLAQKQLQCTLTDNPSLKCYIYIIAKINLAGMNEENDYNKTFDLKMSEDELYRTLGILPKDAAAGLEEFKNDRNLIFDKDVIHIQKVGHIFDKYLYLFKRRAESK